MSAEHEKIAAEAVKLAKKKAVVQETVGLLRKAAKKLQPGSLKGGKSEPASKAKLGSGGRFKALEGKLSKEKGVRNPGALAASIGRAKYGKKGFSKLSAILKKAYGYTAD